MQTTGIPDAEALSAGTGQSQLDGGIVHAVVTVALGDLAGEAGANGAVGIAYVVLEGTTGLGLNGRECIRYHLLGQLALVERRILRLGAELWLVGQ